MENFILMKKFATLDELVFVLKSIEKSFDNSIIDDKTKELLLKRKHEVIDILVSKAFKQDDYDKMNYLLQHNPFFNPNYSNKSSLGDLFSCLISINKGMENATSESEINYYSSRKFYLMAIMAEKEYIPSSYCDLDKKSDKKILSLNKANA